MRRLVSIVVACGVLGLVAQPLLARPQVGAAGAVQEYVFPTGAGILFFHVRPERADDFEAVVVRLGAALDRSPDPVRKQQAATWRIFRSAEAAGETVVYLFVFDPAVVGADYDPVKILGEDAPAEVTALFERLRADVVRVERMGLTKLR
jgi:hypothetical protein